MWIPECCSSKNEDVTVKMRNKVTLYYQKLLTNTVDNVQSNSYSQNFLITKHCHIKDRSLIAQDSAINSGVHSPDTSKELIFPYFKITDLKFNEVEWGGARFKVLSSSPVSAVTLDGKKYFASDSQPFISILIELKKVS